MSEPIKPGCARPVSGPAETQPATDSAAPQQPKEVSSMILIGKPAPDFTAPGYHKGEFVNVRLSDYRGKWVLLCFYPGDFTFV